MNHDDAFVLRVIQTIVAGILLFAASVNVNNALFVNAGYTRTTLPGDSGSQWVREAK